MDVIDRPTVGMIEGLMGSLCSGLVENGLSPNLKPRRSGNINTKALPNRGIEHEITKGFSLLLAPLLPKFCFFFPNSNI